MVSFIEIYRSKFSEIPEALYEEIFINEEKGNIYEDDRLFCNAITEIIRVKNINIKDTYFIVEIGHAHLPGIAVEFLKLNFDVYFFIPSYAHPRMKETIAYFSGNHIQNKVLLRKPINGYVTLLDCHRHDYSNKEYNLNQSSLPTAKFLKKKGITKIILLNEGEFGKETVLPQKDIKPIIENYKQAGIEYYGYGINKREINTFQKNKKILNFFHQ